MIIILLWNRCFLGRYSIQIVRNLEETTTNITTAETSLSFRCMHFKNRNNKYCSNQADLSVRRFKFSSNATYEKLHPPRSTSLTQCIRMNDKKMFERSFGHAQKNNVDKQLLIFMMCAYSFNKVRTINKFDVGILKFLTVNSHLQFIITAVTARISAKLICYQVIIYGWATV